MSRGPVLPVHCSTVELKDLGDTIDFDKEGKEGMIYGLQLNNKGFYARKEIDDRFPLLKQIRDLDLPDTVTDGAIYALKKNKGKWIIHSLESEVKILWLIHFEFYSPHTLMGEESSFRKCLNEKPQIVSLVPEVPDSIKVRPFLQDRYSLEGEGNLKFIPTVALGESWTVVIDFMCKKVTGTNRHITDILNSIRISWADLVQDTRVRLLIEKNGGNIITRSSLPSLRIQTPDTSITTLEIMNIRYINLIGFYYIPQALRFEQAKLLDN